MSHTDKEIELSQKANEIYCDLGQKIETLQIALKNIMDACDGNNPEHMVFYFTAKQALDDTE